MKRCLVGVVALLALFEGTAHTQELKVVGLATRTESTVLSVLERERCDSAWLSQALKDSGIKIKDRDNLSVGDKVLLNTRSCKLPAPESVARETRAILGLPEPQPKTAEIKPIVKKPVKKVAPKPVAKPKPPAEVTATPPKIVAAPKKDPVAPIKVRPLFRVDWVSSREYLNRFLVFLGGMSTGIVLMLMRSNRKKKHQPRYQSNVGPNNP